VLRRCMVLWMIVPILQRNIWSIEFDTKKKCILNKIYDMNGMCILCTLGFDHHISTRQGSCNNMWITSTFPGTDEHYHNLTKMPCLNDLSLPIAGNHVYFNNNVMWVSWVYGRYKLSYEKMNLIMHHDKKKLIT